jgi:gliding motility-associated-like protein
MQTKTYRTIFFLFIFFTMTGLSVYACSVKPSFSNYNTHTCGLPTIVHASNTSTGTQNSSAKYWWKVNGVLSTDTVTGRDSVLLFLKKAGTGTVKLFVKDSSGCIDSVSRSITVSSNAKTILDENGNYTLSPTWTNCIQFTTDPDTFRIKLSSADTLKKVRILWGDGSSYIPGGDMSPNTIQSHLYTTLGIFTVKIITTNGTCTDTVYGTVYSQRQPTAGIIGPPSGSNRGCVPHTLRIINNSYNISDLTTFEINWGIGTLQTLPASGYADTVYHTYRAGICSGVITITARNACGSSFTTWNPIDISDVDSAKWTVTTTCDPTKPYVFRNDSKDNYCLMPDLKEYYWDFGDGTNTGWSSSKASQSHKYKKEGDYSVTLIVRTGCGNDTFVNKVRVMYTPVAGFMFNANRGCKPLLTKLTDTSSGMAHTRLWTVKDGSKITAYSDSILNYTFVNAGVNSVSLKVTNLCGSSTLTRNFIVNDKPKAGFAKINGSCVPMAVTFTNTSTSYFSNPAFSWDFGDGTTSTQKNPPAKTYSSAGNYTVTLLVSDSCGTDTFRQTFTAYGLPKAVLSGDTTGCTFDSLAFNNQSVNSNTYNWDFGDNSGLTSSQTGITKHVYTVNGAYTIRLISGTGSGCKDTTYHQVFIKPGAKALFDIDKPYACSPATFKFTNNSIYGKDFFWYANGRLISTNKNLPDSLLKTDSAIVRLKLVATSTSSCQGDSIEKVYFTPKNPRAIISGRDSGCGTLKVNFKNGSLYAASYFWNLANGITSSAFNPSTSYASAMKKDTVYYPELKVTNWAGCRDSVKIPVIVYPGPGAAFTMDTDNGCGPLKVTFTNTSITNNNDPFSTLSFQWGFGDGNTSVSADPAHSFAPDNHRDTVYHISLKTTTINGCFDSISHPVKVYPQPSIRFTPDKTSGCAILPVNFSNLSSPKDTGNIGMMTFEWSSGNGVLSTNRNFNAAYRASLTNDTVYQVKLKGYSEHGCYDSALIDITVHPQPLALFSLTDTSACTPVNIGTINQSRSMDGGPLKHLWNFGNSFISNQENDSSIYYNNSNSDLPFTISYQAISQYGCRDTAKQQLIARPTPIAKFSVSTKRACAPVALTLIDNSTNASIYHWGQGNRPFTGNATENLMLPGIKLFDTLYTIWHQVVSPYGCPSDTVYEQVIALARPEADFELDRDSVCAGENINLINNSLGGFRYLWKFSDNTSSTLINPRHKFPAKKGSGVDSGFLVTLEVTSAASCKDTFSRNVYTVNKSSDKITLDKPIGCTDLEVTMRHGSSSFRTLFWDFGDYTGRANADTAVHTYINPLGNLTMQPRISLYRQRFNCLDTIYTSVLVYPKPAADFITQRTDPCDEGIFQFINKSRNNVQNEWTVDSSFFGVSSFSTLLPRASVNDTFFSVKLLVSNNYQCKDSMMQVVRVKPKLQIKFQQESPVTCENGIVQFTNKSINSVRYFWKFGDGGMSSEESPSYTYTNYGNYKILLYGYDRDGCVDSSDGQSFYKVLETPRADFSYLPLLPKLPNALVNFKALPTITTVDKTNLGYEWDFGDGTFPAANNNQMDPAHVYTKAGVMMVTLNLWNQQCSATVSKPIYIEDPKPVVDFTPDTLEGCAPFSVKFRNNTTNALSYRWVFSDGSPDSYEKEPTHIFQFEGSWEVTLIATGSGGSNTLTKTSLITTYPKPYVDFYTNRRFLSLPNAVFSMQNNSHTVQNDWIVYDSTGSIVGSSTLRDPSFYVSQAGRLSVRLIGSNSYGCVDTMIKKDYLSTVREGYVYVPTAFSPNKNNRNDDFHPSLYNVRSDNYVFRIYNRWGEKLFETTDILATWDGIFRGQPCEQDTYIWTVNGEYINADLFAFRGTVTLLR